MDRWMDGWMDGWMHRWMDGWMHTRMGCADRLEQARNSLDNRRPAGVWHTALKTTRRQRRKLGPSGLHIHWQVLSPRPARPSRRTSNRVDGGSIGRPKVRRRTKPMRGSSMRDLEYQPSDCRSSV
ncbi:uncharacterized protein BJ171DRAFT_513074 [Polychytrium aggregatum]|uniref:uncharacterized protein n=1 Tax=Polychytrium aggregatum TaxID=110093 RepID=UPI0022FE98BC|nr:uncharacterized protein BJ171DRAFT_513074 [Polychytrium aggregatum]KAI9202727.1 hypothetical protein BJ171DRAFT_513074 [Polychytrium aggregatum]